jgi:hypothetical protein
MNRALIWMTSLIAVSSIALTACSSGSGSASLFGGAAAPPASEVARAEVPAKAVTERPGGVAAAVASRSAGQGSGIDPCGLVTADEARSALGGRQPKGAKHTDFLGDPQCLYEEPEDGDVVSIVIDATNRGREAKESHEFIRRTLGYEQVRGVGDAAFIQPGLNVIDVVAGGTRFQIQIASYALPEAELRAKLIELGKGAVARLR